MKVCFIFRKYADTPSIERVFATVGDELIRRGVDVSFSRLPFGNGALGLVLNLLFYRAPSADILHITGHVHYIALKLPSERTLLTVHDAGILRNRRGLRRALIRRLYFDWPLRRTGLTAAASEATRLELIEKTGCAPEKMIVIGHPVIGGLPRRMQFDALEPKILHIGTAPHKNLSRLIEAVKGMPCKLMIVGRLDANTKSHLEAGGIDFENIEAATDAEMSAIYTKTDILAFCSTFEGFGLPTIEAQSAGIPVLTSNIPPMSDVAGEGAVLVDPFDVQSIRAGLQLIISDIQRREQIVQAGWKNVLRFSPAAIADLYLDAYQHLSSAGNSFK